MPPNNKHSATSEMDTHTCHLPDEDVMESMSALNDPNMVKFLLDEKITAKNKSLPRIYIASKTIHAPKWRRLRTEGYNIISTWIDEAGFGQTHDYAELSVRCIKEIRQSDFLVLYCEDGEILKGALIEAGIALAFGEEVRSVGKCDILSRVFSKHPLWKEYLDIYPALNE